MLRFVRVLLCLCVAVCGRGVAYADAGRNYALEIAETTEYMNLLQAEIDKMDSELIRCRKAKKTWTAVTVVGAVGVIGTGVGAVVQANKISKAKKEGKQEQTDSNSEKEKMATDSSDKND